MTPQSIELILSPYDIKLHFRYDAVQEKVILYCLQEGSYKKRVYNCECKAPDWLIEQIENKTTIDLELLEELFWDELNCKLDDPFLTYAEYEGPPEGYLSLIKSDKRYPNMDSDWSYLLALILEYLELEHGVFLYKLECYVYPELDESISVEDLYITQEPTNSKYLLTEDNLTNLIRLIRQGLYKATTYLEYNDGAYYNHSGYDETYSSMYYDYEAKESNLLLKTKKIKSLPPNYRKELIEKINGILDFHKPFNITNIEQLLEYVF